MSDRVIGFSIRNIKLKYWFFLVKFKHNKFYCFKSITISLLWESLMIWYNHNNLQIVFVCFLLFYLDLKSWLLFQNHKFRFTWFRCLEITYYWSWINWIQFNDPVNKIEKHFQYILWYKKWILCEKKSEKVWIKPVYLRLKFE